MMNHIKWAWQRVVRGYDDRLFWGGYYDTMILAQLEYMRHEAHGYPAGITLKKWHKALDVMIAGFQPEPEWKNVKEYKKWQKTRQKALVLFAFYYDALWD